MTCVYVCMLRHFLNPAQSKEIFRVEALVKKREPATSTRDDGEIIIRHPPQRALAAQAGASTSSARQQLKSVESSVAQARLKWKIEKLTLDELDKFTSKVASGICRDGHASTRLAAMKSDAPEQDAGPTEAATKQTFGTVAYMAPMADWTPATLDLIALVDAELTKKGSERKIVLDGPGGIGKSATLLQLASHYRSFNYGVVYIPNPTKFINATLPYAEGPNGSYVQPEAAKQVLQTMASLNSELFANISIHGKHELNGRSITGSLIDLVDVGIKSPDVANAVVDGVLKELITYPDTRPPVVFVVDEVNALLAKTAYCDRNSNVLTADKFALMRSFLRVLALEKVGFFSDLADGLVKTMLVKLDNGAVICATERTSSRFRSNFIDKRVPNAAKARRPFMDQYQPLDGVSEFGTEDPDRIARKYLQRQYRWIYYEWETKFDRLKLGQSRTNVRTASMKRGERRNAKKEKLQQLKAIRENGGSTLESLDVKRCWPRRPLTCWQSTDGEAIYDTVTEAEYESYKRKRVEDDFVVDDDGLGYADYGEDDFGEQEESESEEEAAAGPRKKTKKDEGSKKKAKPEARITKFFSNQAQTAPAAKAPANEVAFVNEEDLMADIFNNVDSHVKTEAQKVEETKQHYNKPEPPRARTALERQAISRPAAQFTPARIHTRIACEETSVEEYDHNMQFDEGNAKDLLDNTEPVEEPRVKEEEVDAAEAAKERAKAAPSYRKIQTRAPSASMPSFVPKFAPAAPEKPSVLNETVENSKSWTDAHNAFIFAAPSSAVGQTSSQGSSLSASNLGDYFELDGKLHAFWFDAFERDGRDCLYSVEMEEISMGDVYAEFDSVRKKFKIKEFMSRPVTRKYAFEIPGIPVESEYLKVVYPFKEPVLPADLADPDIIVGHNFTGVYLDVLLHRMKSNKVDHWSKLGRLRRNKWPKLQNGAGGSSESTIEERRDYLTKLKSFTLTNLAKTQLNVNREDFDLNMIPSMFWETGKLSKLIQHSELDAILAAQIMFKIQVLPLTKQLTNLSGNLWVRSRTIMTGSRSDRNEYLLLHEFHNKKYILPDKPQRNAKYVDFQRDDDNAEGQKAQSGRRKPAYSGGLVLEPKKGFYDKFVLMLDFNSLYPSIIQEFNICFTTYDIRQQALKLTANSMYGCLGFSHSRFYAKPLAMLVTQNGREVLQATVDLAEKEKLEVIYGDTDSIMIHTNSISMSEVLRIGNEFKKNINKRYRMLEIEIDGVYTKMLLLKKKKYAAQTILPSGEVVLEKKGLDIVRRDWCSLSHEVSEYILKQIFSDVSSEDLTANIHEYLAKVGEEVRDGKAAIDKFVINKGLTKKPEDYTDIRNQPHVQVALALKEKGHHVRVGDTVPYVICVGESNALAGRAHHPDELRTQDTKLVIDFNYYLANQVLPPIARLLAPIESTNQGRLAECLGLYAVVMFALTLPKAWMYTDEMLMTQLKYFSALFDVDRIKRTYEKHARNHIVFIGTLPLRATVEAFLSINARMTVNLSHLFNTAK
ncbi:hypothetical protein HK101_009401 [Irineochytrium annulatum]|nr:hypothetical protein HK101_009401 [Irineochytrium annulatum]